MPASVGLPQFNTLAVANWATSESKMFVPFYSEVGIERSGSLENFYGYKPNGSSYVPQTIAAVQTEPGVTTINFTMQTADKNSFQLLVNGKFTPGSSVIWEPIFYKIVAANIITDAGLVGKTLGEVDVTLVRTEGNEPTISFEKITTGTPTASQAKFDFTAGTITFATGLYNGLEMTYTFPKTDTVNIDTVGGPGVTAPRPFNTIEFTGVAGVATGFVIIRAPRVVKSTEFSFTAGTKTDLTFSGQAVLASELGFGEDIAWNWVDDTAAAFLN